MKIAWAKILLFLLWACPGDKDHFLKGLVACLAFSPKVLERVYQLKGWPPAKRSASATYAIVFRLPAEITPMLKKPGSQ